jgi:predicted nucleic acid-binding protein
VATIDRVFIDTSELFPFTIMDVLLTLAEDFLITWVWTDDLLDEWEHVIVREKQRTAESARSVTDAARASFGAGRINAASYRDRITDDLSPDPGDRAHVAACLDGRADVLLTGNLKHFSTPLLAEHHVEVMTADDYLIRLLRRRPAAVLDAFKTTAAARRNPPIAPADLAVRVERAGAPLFATAVRRRLTKT